MLSKTEKVFVETICLGTKRLWSKIYILALKNKKRGVNGHYYIPWMQTSILHISLDL